MTGSRTVVLPSPEAGPTDEWISCEDRAGFSPVALHMLWPPCLLLRLSTSLSPTGSDQRWSALSSSAQNWSVLIRLSTIRMDQHWSASWLLISTEQFWSELLRTKSSDSRCIFQLKLMLITSIKNSHLLNCILTRLWNLFYYMHCMLKGGGGGTRG